MKKPRVRKEKKLEKLMKSTRRKVPLIKKMLKRAMLRRLASQTTLKSSRTEKSLNLRKKMIRPTRTLIPTQRSKLEESRPLTNRDRTNKTAMKTRKKEKRPMNFQRKSLKLGSSHQQRRERKIKKLMKCQRRCLRKQEKNQRMNWMLMINRRPTPASPRDASATKLT